MKLLLTASLMWALLCGAEALRCHVCDNSDCSNTTSVECPPTHTICKTITTVNVDQSASISVNKNCSLPLSCITPLGVLTEWSVNLGYVRESHTQTCCVTDNCNFQSVPIPNVFPNGKVCPGCASFNDSLAGTCNTTVDCRGAEDSCFNGTTMSNSTQGLQLGCISRNLCTLQAIVAVILDENTSIVCGAPWSIRVSGVLVTFALSAQKFLL